MPPDTLTISEAARRYGVDRTTIQRKIKRGELKRGGRGASAGVTLASLAACFGEPLADVNTTSDEGAACSTHAAGMQHAAPHAAKVRHAAPAPDPLAALTAAHAREIAAKDAHIKSLDRELERADTEKRELRGALQLEQQKTAKMLLMLDAPKGASAAPFVDVTTEPDEPATEKRTKHRRTTARARRVKVEIKPTRPPPPPAPREPDESPSIARGLMNRLSRFIRGRGR